MLNVARVVVSELMRRGDLLRVAIEGGSDQEGPFCVLKGTNRLVDLSLLGGNPVPFLYRQATAADSANGHGSGADSAAGPYSLNDFAGMLGAMEQAQDLEIGDPQSGENSVILASILRLLARFTPQFRLFIMLGSPDAVPDGQVRVFNPDPEETADGWLSMRTEGHSAWIPTPGEFPAHIRQLDGQADNNGHSNEAFSFDSGVAVPLFEPSWDDENAPGSREVGLFFLVARDDWGREPLLRLGDRLSRFVTRRWQHQREVNQRIHTDSLTGVYNRAFFDTQFTRELERARRSEVPLTLVIADLDFFKTINDDLGHHVGDRVLKMVAHRLQEELRRIDHICRIGGEEFALILPDTSLAAARDVLTRLLNARYCEQVVHQGEVVDIEVTFSFGAVTFPGAGTDAFELYRKADAMLYLSKDLGRNQCHFWSSEGDHVSLLPDAEST